MYILTIQFLFFGALTARPVLIRWSPEHGLPVISVSVGEVWDSYTIDTSNSDPIPIRNGTQRSDVTDLGVGFPGSYSEFRSRVQIATDNQLFFPVGTESTFAALPAANRWFTIDPQYLYPFTPVMQAPRIDGSDAPNVHIDIVDARFDTPGWQLTMSSGLRVIIDSRSPDMHIPRTDYEALMSEIRSVLNETENRYGVDDMGNFVIHTCSTGELDDFLPEITFSFPNIHGQNFDISFSAREYMRHVNDGRCYLGIRPTDSVPRLGAALFRKYSVSFNRRQRLVQLRLASSPVYL